MTRSAGGRGPPGPRVALAGYDEAVAALEERGRFGMRLGLGRTRALLRLLGDPQLRFRGALVGGTNGKGSVQAMVAAVLAASGRRVGQTPKPHLSSYRERIVVDGQPIPTADFVDLVAHVLERAEEVDARLGAPTEFELLTAASFAWFARCGVELAVVEVGLGGRLDATNTWDGGVAAITNVDWDHMDRLGDTLEAIGREKAAIIKRGDRAVTGATGPGLGPIRRRARRLRVPLREVPPLPVRALGRDGLVVTHPDLGDLRLGLLGAHQAANAGVALAVVEALESAGLAQVSADAIRKGLASARWPGRLELLTLGRDGRAARADTRPRPGTPDLVLDGAHNAAGMKALVDALGELRADLSPGRPTLLVALMADKDVTGMLRHLAAAPWLASARIITTTVGSERSLPPARLAEAWQSALGEVDGWRRDPRAPGAAGPEPIEAPAEALARAIEVAREEDGVLVVCGSLYLVGSVRDRLVGEPTTGEGPG